MPEYKAVVDIGTNSFHLIVVEIKGEGRVNTIHREKVVMRIGTEGEGVLKHISDTEIEKSVEVLDAFKKLADFYKAELYAVATSAVRESDNKDKFIDIIYKRCGIKIDIIDGRTEASYIYFGVENALPVKGKKLLCTDIGGGSTEVIIGFNGDYDFIQSYKLGAVRLSKMFFPGYIITPEAVRNCSEYIVKVFNETNLINFKSGYDVAVGASGTIIAIAAVVAVRKYGHVPKDLNGFSFTSSELNAIAETILNYATVEERSLITGMERGRADIIPSGVLILKHIFSILEIKEMTISTYALREGYLLKIVKKS